LRLILIFYFSAICWCRNEDDAILTSKLVDEINSIKDCPWIAGFNLRFEGKSWRDAQRMLGFRPNSKYRSLISNYTNKNNNSMSLPNFFDSREQWGNCIQPVRDQGSCGGCWAFATSESLGDRICIATKNSTNVVLSVEELISCNDFGLEGCIGGDPFTAFIYTSLIGLPSDECYPYCSSNGTTGICRSSCTNNLPWVKYYSDMWTIEYHLFVSGIQESIFSNGPVAACFSVYEDFFSYTSGVYVHQSGDYVAGHCVLLIGWGHDNTSGLDYWIVQNSWGTDWGMNGFFFIEKGVDMCGIERESFSALPSL